MPQVGISYECFECRTPFVTEHPRHIYCSIRCRDNRNNRVRREDKATRTYQCAHCGNPFHRTRAHSKKQFCSQICQHEFYWSKPANVERRRASQRTWLANNPGYATAANAKWYEKKKGIYPWASLLTCAKRRATMKGIAFTLDFEWGAAHWTGQCELTGIPFAAASERKGRANRIFFPSIDRIDAAKGYTPDNCRFVLWAVNALKNDGTEEQMYMIARALISNQSHQKGQEAAE